MERHDTSGNRIHGASSSGRQDIITDAIRRDLLCRRCRQRLPNDLTIHCPACQKQNPLQEHRWHYDRRFKEPLCRLDVVEVCAAKLRNKLSISGGGKYGSLNCDPSPLEAPKSPPGTRKPRKRALLIGVTYKKWKYRLKGTINDVRNIRSLLVDNFGFSKENILVLTDYAEEEPSSKLIPTKQNIEESLKWLVHGVQGGDSLVFYFSGHGLRQPDFADDEIDGFDETICPTDFLQEGMILDNYINATIVKPLPKGVTLHAIVDACHSGTVLDLLFVYNRETKHWDDNKPPSGAPKHTSGGLAISISACEDNQVAADTSAFTGKAMNGALTYVLVDIVKKKPDVTYGALIDMIHESFEKTNQSGCLSTKIIRQILNERLLQKPLLSASEPFNVYDRQFHL